jgi:N-acetyl-gamma-glutamyl-phosphate reductase
MSIRVGIVGISGFGGGEALRLIASHPSFELVYAAGEGSAGSRLIDRFPSVPDKLADLVIEKWDPAALPKLGSGFITNR